MRYLRRIITRQDRVQNDEIRRVWVDALTELVEENQLRWFGHLITTMNDSRLPKIIWKSRATAKRKRGRSY